MGKVISCSDHARQTPNHLSRSDLGRAQNAGPTESAPLRTTWVPEPEWLRPGMCMQRVPGGATESLSSMGRKGTRTMSGGQAQCGWDTASTRQCYLFAASLPPHSATEQVSLKKYPPPPPCVRLEIRHGRDQQTEEAKTEGIVLEVTDAID